MQRAELVEVRLDVLAAGVEVDGLHYLLQYDSPTNSDVTQ